MKSRNILLLLLAAFTVSDSFAKHNHNKIIRNDISKSENFI